jgi:hypothetical protein
MVDCKKSIGWTLREEDDYPYRASQVWNLTVLVSDGTRVYGVCEDHNPEPEVVEDKDLLVKPPEPEEPT